MCPRLNQNRCLHGSAPQSRQGAQLLSRHHHQAQGQTEGHQHNARTESHRAYEKMALRKHVPIAPAYRCLEVADRERRALEAELIVHASKRPGSDRPNDADRGQRYQAYFQQALDPDYQRARECVHTGLAGTALPSLHHNQQAL